MTDVGYKRISAGQQDPEKQLAGVLLERVFIDKQPDASTKRPQLEACIKYLREGDRLHIDSMCRVARNMKDLQGFINKLIKKGITIEFYQENVVIGNDPHPLNLSLLNFLKAVAGLEADVIKERQSEALKEARKSGVRMGRSKILTDAKIEQALLLIAKGIPKNAVAEHFGVARQTLYVRLKDYEKRKAAAGKIKS